MLKTNSDKLDRQIRSLQIAVRKPPVRVSQTHRNRRKDIGLRRRDKRICNEY